VCSLVATKMSMLRQKISGHDEIQMEVKG